MISYELLKVLIVSFISFFLAILLIHPLLKFLKRQKVGKNIRNDGDTPVFSALHASKQGTPTMAGILIWFTVTVLIVGFWFLDRVLHIQFFHFLNFLTRKETLLPMGAFLGASFAGLFDDYLDLKGKGYKGRGLRFRHKILVYIAVAAIGAYWFYFKLGFSMVAIPFGPDLNLHAWYILFFIFVVVGSSFAVNETDGLDGLAGGTLLFSFVAYTTIAYLEGFYQIAALSAAVIGALLAFLWMNIPPAKFFMGDTGSMGLGTLLAVIAFLVNGTLVLPFIGIVFVIEALSYFIQIFWRKVYKKKFLLSAPIHNHLQAKGWSESQVVMRFWIISMAFSVLGVIIYFTGIRF
jgi:phospho-N-acetylmuramoyl-pentapeptide-transferase